MTEHKNRLEKAADLLVFAPLGFVAEARRLLPTFVERGHQQVQMAKVVGKFATQAGQAEATRRLGRIQEQAGTLLDELGIAGRRPADAPVPQPDEAPTTSPSITQPPRSSAAAEALPISDYDSLAASQVIPRLAGLSPAELEAVRAYEATHRGRKTILGKVAQLTGA